MVVRFDTQVVNPTGQGPLYVITTRHDAPRFVGRLRMEETIRAVFAKFSRGYGKAIYGRDVGVLEEEPPNKKISH